MSILSDKYGVPEPAIRNMIKDGVISCSWATYEEVANLRKQGKTVDEIAIHFQVSRRHIYNILNKVK